MEKEQDLSERGTHGGPKQRRKTSGAVHRSTAPMVTEGRSQRRAKRRLAQRTAAFTGGMSVRAPGSMKTS